MKKYKDIPIHILAPGVLALGVMALLAGIVIGSHITTSASLATTFSILSDITTSLGLILTAAIAFVGLFSWKHEYQHKKHDNQKKEISIKCHEIIESIQLHLLNRVFRQLSRGSKLRMANIEKVIGQEIDTLENFISKCFVYQSELQHQKHITELEDFEDLSTFLQRFLVKFTLIGVDLNLMTNQIGALDFDSPEFKSDLVVINDYIKSINVRLHALRKDLKSI